MSLSKLTKSWLVVLLLAISVFVVGVSAQNRKPKTSAKPTPTVSPTPPQGDAEVISRADEQAAPLVFLEPTNTKPSEPQTDSSNQKIKDLTARIKKLEAERTSEYDEKQKRLLLNLDILTRAEERADGLRKQLFDMIEKENTLKLRIDQIESESRPEIISRSATFSGSMKPEEIREMRKRSLDAEKFNLQSLLVEVQQTRANLTANLQRADQMVEKLRAKLEKEIDDALTEPQEN